MSTPESKLRALQKRLVLFGAEIFQIPSKLPNTWQASHAAKQDKLRLVLKELNETTVWLQLIVESSLLSRDKTIAIVAENEELCRIIGGSIRTAGGFDRS